MRSVIQIVTLIGTLVFAANAPLAQSVAKDANSLGSISGAITLGGKPASKVKVVAIVGGYALEGRVAAIAFTDEGGRYQLKGIPAGQCTVTADAPALTIKDKKEYSISFGRSVDLDAGENIEGIDIDLTPGGVITGRITEANGRPVIDEAVDIIPLRGEKHEDRSPSISWVNDKLRVKTDDRGVYRAYGLPPGQYKVKVGDRLSARVAPSFGRVPIPISYYPGVTDNSKAEVVEIAEGGEATNIDIKVNRPSPDKSKVFTVTGRIVDAETGKPLSDIGFSLDNYNSDRGDRLEGNISEYEDTDPRGEFRVEGLPPGEYEIEVRARKDSPWYSKKVEFEISNADVEGLEIKVYRAGSISGVVVLEGVSDPAVVAELSKLKVGEEIMVSGGVPVNADGTFNLTGTGPGNHYLGIDTGGGQEGFELLRIERDGAEQRLRQVKVGPGEHVTGVRLVVAYYKGVVRGQITIEGGTLPKDAYLDASATPTNQPPKDTSWTKSKRMAAWASRWRRGIVDSRGRFVIRRLPPGEYEVILDLYLTPLKVNDDDDDDGPTMTAKKTVMVTDRGEVEVSFVVDLSKKPEEKRQ